jgi:hypothetical protein
VWSNLDCALLADRSVVHGRSPADFLWWFKERGGAEASQAHYEMANVVFIMRKLRGSAAKRKTPGGWPGVRLLG